MNSLNVALVGTGNIAEHAFRAFSKIPNVTVTAACSRPSARRDEFCNQFSIGSVFNTLGELLALSSDDARAVDAVFIATPNAFHADQAEEAIRAGKHVLLDKPLATSLGDAQKIERALAISKSPVFLLGMDQRFQPAAARLKHAATGGTLGSILDVHAIWRRRSGIPKQGSWFGHKKLSGGGVLLDIGVHLLDLAMYVLDDFDVETVSGQIRSIYGHQGLGYGSWGKSSPADLPFDVEDTASARIRFRSGITLHLQLAWAAPLEGDDVLSLELTGTRGAASLSSNRFIPGPGQEQAVLQEQPPIAPNRYVHFIDLIHKRSEPVVTLEQALKVQAVLDAIYQSSSSGREVVF